jgi:hypothetical protein
MKRSIMVGALLLVATSGSALAARDHGCRDDRYLKTCDGRHYVPTRRGGPDRFELPVRGHARHARGWRHRVIVTRHGARYRRSYEFARSEPRRAARMVVERGAYDRGEIVPHPAGCPRRLFCGCGTAVHIFGAPIRSLWLAANWFRFPSAAPGPGMVAVRRHHVFAIDDYRNGRALAYDPNSGHGLTRRHWVSLAGYRIVNPHGARVSGL